MRLKLKFFTLILNGQLSGELTGDHLVIEQVEDIKTVQYGRTYVLVAKDGCVFKRINSQQNQKKFTLKSDNIIYERYEINKEDIISIWLI